MLFGVITKSANIVTGAAFARAAQYVNYPVAYALYHVWKEADKASEKRSTG